MKKTLNLLLVSLMLTGASPAMARNILISNDDGLTANVFALYEALKAEGHDVIVSIPCTQQSGMGGALKILKPVEKLSSDCVNNAAKAGSHGVGQITHPKITQDFYYVNATPVMSMLYGIDVIAQERWGQNPDLILSGPNIGRNSGFIVVSSGTVSNIQYAIMRGIPAIALSAGMNSESGESLSHPVSTTVAKRSVELVRYLDKISAGTSMLPNSVGLNVNFPDSTEDAKWQFSVIGTYSNYEFKFVPDLRLAFPQQPQAGQDPLPGLFAKISTPEAQPHQINDEAFISSNNISISAIQSAYDAPIETRAIVEKQLSGILNHAK